MPDTQNTSHSRRTCGLAPMVFWVLILLMINLLATAIGAGLVVGLSKSNNSGAGYGNPVLFSCTKLIIPLLSIPTAISISTLSSSSIKEKPTNPPSTSTSPSLSNPNLGRPVNDTLKYTPASNSASSTAYTVNSTTLTYTIHCGFTYKASYNRDGTGNTTDLQYIPLTNLSTCINLCSIYNIQVPDGGAQYGFYDLCSGITVTNNETCQLKSG